MVLIKGDKWMTQYIYLASPMKLASGSFGLNPISPDKSNVFKTELDFAHLYFEKNYDHELQQRFTYSSHFSFKHQAAAFSNHIPLANQFSGTPEEEKCLTILYNYMKDAIETSNIIEYFTSWNGEEDLPLSSKRSVSWLDIKKPTDLILEDRGFIEITLWK